MTRRTVNRLAMSAAVLGIALAPSVAIAQDRASQPPSAVSAVPIPPERIDAAVGQLDGVVDELMRRSGVPGVSVAVVHGDELLYAKGFGVRSVETGVPVDERTVFQLASLSKPVGATVVAREVGRGTVEWDDLVTEHLPWFALKDPDTTRQLQIADLYSHRSGLPDHGGDLLEDLGYGRTQILRRLRELPLTPIRTEYAYTNFGLTAAGVAVANAAGTDWSTLSERALYRPLGMTETSSRYADFIRRPNRAVPHVRGADGWVARYQRQPQAQSPAGGVSSNVLDMAKWMRLQLAQGEFEGRRLVAAGPLATMRTPHSVSEPPSTFASRTGLYGLGIGVNSDAAGRVRLSHSGAFEQGAATNVVLLPSERLGIIVLTNGQPVGLPEAITASFMDLVELGEIERDWLSGYGGLFDASRANHSRLAGRARPSDAPAGRPQDQLVGVYENDYYGPARVLRRGGQLVMLLGPDGSQAFRLRHWSGDVYSYRPRGENAAGISSVSFRGRSGTKAAQLRVEYLDEYGLGTFRRR
jgi:CubicO group peptidase (beta-lactamase class C family)